MKSNRKLRCLWPVLLLAWAATAVAAPPEFVQVYNQRILYNELFTLNITATDPQGWSMTFTASNKPPSAIFTPFSTGGVLNYVPSSGEIGMTYTTTFYAVSAGGTAAMDVPITIVGTEEELALYHAVRQVVDGFGGRMESASYVSETAGAQGQPIGWIQGGNYRNSAGFLTPDSDAATSVWEIVATATTGGTIAPSGTVQVANGSNQVFSIAPNEYYAVSNVVVDGISIGSTNAYEFMNVVSNGTIHAVFAELRTTQGVPYGWLASYGLTNQPWNEAAAADQGCGRPAWEAWVAGTDPTNPATAFVVLSVESSGGGMQMNVRTVPGRLYTFKAATNMLDPVWNPIEYSLTPGGELTTGTLTATSGQSTIYVPVGHGEHYIRSEVQRPEN